MSIQWLFLALMAVVIMSVVLTVIGSWSPQPRGWLHHALRLRPLILGLLVVALGLWTVIDALLDRVDWISLVIGLLAIGVGAVWVYSSRGSRPDYSVPTGD